MTFPLLALLATRAVPTTVTYTNNGARMAVILPELSKLTGVKLAASKEMAGRVLILRLDDAPKQAVLDRIAHATYGKWEKDHDELKLVRDADRIEKETEASKRKFVEEIARALARIGTVTPKPSSTDGASGAQADVVSPDALAIRALLPALDPDVIGNLPVDRQIVFSTRPQPLQDRLPTGAGAVFTRLLSSVRVWPRGDGDTAAVDPTHDFAKGDLVVSHDSRALNFTILLYYTDGKLMCRHDKSIDFREATAQPKPSSLAADPLPVSQLAKDFAQVAAGIKPLTPAIRERLMDPLKYDPDSFFGEILASYAQALNRQLVASPPDTDCRPLYSSDPVTSLRAMQALLDVEHDHIVDDGSEDGWIEMSDPIEFPSDDGFGQTDRAMLARTVKAIPKTESVSLLDLVHADRAGLGQFEGLPQEWLCRQLLDALAMNNVVDRLSKLSDAEIDLLLAGKSLSLGGVSPSFQDDFANLTLSTELNPQLLPPPPSQTVRSAQLSSNGAPISDAWQEYTEVASTYAPPQATVQLTLEDAASLTILTSRPSPAPPFWLAPDDVIFHDGNVPGLFPGFGAEFRKRNPEWPVFGALSERPENIRANDRFRLGTNHTYRLRVTYAPSIYCEDQVTTTSFDEASKPMAFKELSKNLQSLAREYVREVGDLGQVSPNSAGGGGP